MNPAEKVNCPAIDSQEAACAAMVGRQYRIDPENLIERFPVQTPSGDVWQGRLYAVPHRREGRRILLLDPTGFVRFDTQDQHNLGNAAAAVDGWLTAVLHAFCARVPPLYDALTRLLPFMNDEFPGSSQEAAYRKGLAAVRAIDPGYDPTADAPLADDFAATVDRMAALDPEATPLFGIVPVKGV